MNPLFHSIQVPKQSLIPHIFRVGLCLALLVTALALALPVEAGSSSLTGLLPAYTRVSNVTITPDSKYVVFMADIDVDERTELYSVPITGTVPLKLNPALVSNGNVKEFIILPDSNRVIYTADQELNESIELYSVPISGGEVIKLNWPLPVGGNVVQMEYDEGTGQVIYMADQDINDVFMLFAVQPTDSITMINLTPTYIAGGTVSSYAIDPVGSRVVWIGKPDAGSMFFELYSRPIFGGTTLKLNPLVVEDIHEFAITPDFAQVVFIAREVFSSNLQLYRNSTFGGTAVKRSHPLAGGENVLSFRVSPTGLRVVYSVGPNDLGGKATLWGTRTFSGQSDRLTEAAETSFGVDPQGFFFSPDGNRLVYKYQQNAAAPYKLQSVWVSGGPLERMDLHLPENDHGVGNFIISPDSQTVVFGDFFHAEFLPTLYAIPIAGGSKISLGQGGSPQVTPDSQRVIYQFIQPPNDHSDVISVQITGGDERNLSRSAVNNHAHNPVMSPDGQWIVYEFRINGGASFELRVSDGTDTPNLPPAPTPPSQFMYLPILVK